MTLFESADAIFSPCRAYRYWLSREWNPDRPRVVFVMMNPSTADADKSDPTITRCLNFAESWGFGSLGVLNLFAYRSPYPEALRKTKDPVGPENDRYLYQRTAHAGRIILAWGALHKRLLWRVPEVLTILADGGPLHCLGTTKEGQPRHPLYVRGDTEPVIYTKGS